MGITVVTPPTYDPLTLIEAKDHLRETSADEDGNIAGYILAARQAAEDFTRRKFATQTIDVTIDHGWPTCKVNGVTRPRIVLPFPPVQSITSITYYDGNGDLQTLATDQYRADLTDGEARIDPAYGVTWPTVRDQTATIKVRMVCGYGVTNFPEPIRQALKLAVGNMYKHRETVVTGTIATELPAGAQVLLFPYRVFY